MEFNTLLFITVFFPLVFISYFLIKDRFKNIWLLLFSLLFYVWSGIEGMIIFLVISILNFIWGRVVQVKHTKKILIIGIIFNVMVLGYFKYMNFFLDNFNKIFGMKFEILSIIIPIGISFFIFKAISYLVDVYKGKTEAEKNFIDFTLYMMFFPQVLSGPIVRYIDMKNELKNRIIEIDDVRYGFMRFITGLGKKVFIANNLGALADSIWVIPLTEMPMAVAWLGSIAYTLQIYFDFSAYSDMAIGLARMFGFHFLENFNYPYTSKSITEFWRKWHISLSTWFKDYIYIPLGGNRKGNVYFNIFIVFLITGLWHGSAWHFVAWGLWNGVFNVAEKFISSKGYTVGTGNMMQKFCCYIYTIFVVNVGWVFFRAEGLWHALQYIQAMFGMSSIDKPGFDITWFLSKFNIFIVLLAIILCVPYLINFYKKHVKDGWLRLIMENVLLVVLFVLCMIGIVSSSYNSFIYFQF